LKLRNLDQTNSRYCL